MIARLIEQTSHRPEDLFPLSGGSAHIYRRAAQVDAAIWEAAFGDTHKDFEYYQLIEETLGAGFTFRYLLVLDEFRDPVALQPLIIIEHDLTATCGRALTVAIDFIRKIWPRFLHSRILIAGCPGGDSEPGIIAPANPQRVNALLAQALRTYARRHKVPLILAKDFPASGREELTPFIDAGYSRIPGLPPLLLSLNFDSFDEYIETRLSRVTRTNIRRKLRCTEAGAALTSLEVLSECSGVIDEIYPLYLEVAGREPAVLGILPREYFLEAGKRMPDRHRFFVWRREAKVVAFSFCTIWDNALCDNVIGLDYGVARELSLCHRAFHDMVEWALGQGLTEYCSAPFHYASRLHLQLEPVAVDLYVRHRSSVFNALVKRLAPWFAPGKTDPTLRKYLRNLSSA